MVLALLKKDPLSGDDTIERIRIEKAWEYDDLKIIINAVVDRQYQSVNEKLDPTEAAQSKEGWGSWMMRGGGLLYAEQPQTPPLQSTSLQVEKNDRPQLSLKSSEFQITPEFTSNDSYLTRDEKFASVTFQLASGELQLNVESEKATLATIQFKQLKALLSLKFQHETFMGIVELGELLVLDNYTKNTIYSQLVASSSRHGDLNSPVFYFSYESYGVNMTKVHCETAPLTIIYNGPLLRLAKSFFNIKNATPLASDNLDDWRQRKAYQGLKEGAKRNLQSAWEGVLSGRSSSIGSTLHITLDLSAPKIVIPKNITDKNSPQILIDFGRLKFANNRDEYRGSDDEEAFYTPETGTPPSEPTSQALYQSKLDVDELQERLMVSKLYHRYTINLLDLQILVGNHIDSWRAASSAGKSSMHIVEKFNVSLGLERRALDTADTKYPFAMLSGILPSLTLHLNETKCATLWGCLEQLNSKEQKVVVVEENSEPETKKKTPSRLVYMMFQIERVTLGLASELHDNQTIAVLDIGQVKSEIKVSTSHQSCIFSVASIVLADCYQQLGPDFEFILASNSGTYIDIPSGTIIDSGATSPTFEQQEQYVESPNFVSKLTDNLFSLLASNDDAKSEGQSELSSWSHPNHSELAVVEWTHYNEPNGSTGVGDEISARLSSLNIVATPPSVAVLLRLLYRLQPKSNVVIDEDEEKAKNEVKKDRNLSIAKIEVNTGMG